MSTLRILLVDDNAGLRRQVCQLLEEELPRSATLEAGNAEDTLEIVRAAELDLIVLDVHLPDQSGLAILPAIHALRPGLPVVVMSGLPERPYAAAASRAGASAYVSKQRAAEELVPTLRRVLDQLCS